MTIKSTGDETNVKNNNGDFGLPDKNLSEQTDFISNEDKKEFSEIITNAENIISYSTKNKKFVLERKNNKLEAEKNNLTAEQLEIEKEINKLTSAEKLIEKLALVDEKTRENVLGSVAKTDDISSFSGFVQYSYKGEPREEISFKTVDGKSVKETTIVIDTITRSFTLGFKHHCSNQNEEIYAVKIRDKWFLKDDILALYFAFQEEISKSFKFWLEDYRATQEKIKEQKEANKKQLNLFAADFSYSVVEDTIVKLKMYCNYENKWIDFSFPISVGKFHGLRLTKNQVLQSQDIYFLYHNFEKIIKQFLNK